MADFDSVPESSNAYSFMPPSPQDTLPPNLPSYFDDATLTRRRRRRTSPHDQAILEQEYRKCTKPDKVQRREICKLVQMGEKGVQVFTHVSPSHPSIHPSIRHVASVMVARAITVAVAGIAATKWLSLGSGCLCVRVECAASVVHRAAAVHYGFFSVFIRANRPDRRS